MVVCSLSLTKIMSKYTEKQAEYIKKIMAGEIPDPILEAHVEAELGKDMDNSQDKIQGVIYCWNCSRAMQKPKWISKIKGSGNTMNMKCACGESTEIKF